LRHPIAATPNRAKAQPFKLGREETMGDLAQDAGAVAGLRIAATRRAVR